ncbi:hypothetical protein [Aquimarina brevivitae]|nr:hypothetical protein [Aquimarina brevivitae]
MSASKADDFETFLRESIGTEVLVVNSNMGMEVYYYSFKDCSKFIKDTLLIYTINSLDSSKLRFRSNTNEDEVFKCFEEALSSFSQYPQLFLGYVKKFLYLQQKNADSIYLVPILNEYFEKVYTSLSHKNQLPHLEKIEKARSNITKAKDKDLIQNLIAEILKKSHYN